MKAGGLRKLLIPVMLIVLTTVFGCSSGGRDVYEVSSLAVGSFSDFILPDKKPVLKKKILVTPVINKSNISDLQPEEIRQEVISYLSRDEYIQITSLKEWNEQESGALFKSYGTVINPEYADVAGKMGMNIFLSCIIHPVEVSKKRTGVWPFRKESYNILLSISINALDTMNNTLIIFENKTEDIDINKTDTMESGGWTPDFALLKNEISSITKELCSSVTEKLRKQPWQSKLNVDNGNLVISAGSSIGINENTVFEIFKKGELIESRAEGEYYIFGDKIGEAGVKSISRDRTVLASNIDVKDAFYVRVKRD